MGKDTDHLQSRHLLLQLVNELQEQLCQQGLWQNEAPSAAALASSAPFAIDTLTFVQWLQFIFIHKMRGILQFSLPLPQSMSVLPMAEEYFKNQAVNGEAICELIGRIDQLISETKQ